MAFAANRLYERVGFKNNGKRALLRSGSEVEIHEFVCEIRR
jgi:hypothetical protein